MLIQVTKARHAHRAPAGGIDDYRGGQFIPRATMKREVDAAYATMPELIRSFSDRLQFLREVYEMSVSVHAMPGTVDKSKAVPLARIEAQMKTAIRENYARAFILGKRAAGDLTTAKGNDGVFLDRIRKDEFGYLRNFLNDIRTGGGVMDYERRMALYGMAAKEIFWQGWVSGQPAHAVVSWTLGDTQHCTTCDRLAKESPWPIDVFRRDVAAKGLVPQSPSLSCMGFHCLCHITSSATLADKSVPAWAGVN